MTFWTMAQAKYDFGRGLIVSASIQRHFDGVRPYFTVSLKSSLRSETDVGQLIDARKKVPRPFKTMDAACSAVVQVGFLAANFSCNQ